MKKVSFHRVCERCVHPFDERLLNYGEPLPVVEEKRVRCIVNTSDGEQTLFNFDDLCPDCERVVAGFIQKIRMESDGEVFKPKKTSKKNVESKASDSDAEPTHCCGGACGGDGCGTSCSSDAKVVEAEKPTETEKTVEAPKPTESEAAADPNEMPKPVEPEAKPVEAPPAPETEAPKAEFKPDTAKADDFPF